MSSEVILHYLLIKKERLRDWRYVLFYSAVLLFVVVYSYINGTRTGQSSDFNVFWNAGVNFSSRVDLYSRIGGAERFIYPPFAAMLFQIFGLFPMKVAASLYTFVNFILFILSISLTKEILSFYIRDKKKLNYAILFGVICSFRFFWYHTAFVQINELILVLCLYAVLSSMKGREWIAVACIVAGIFIKVLPIFFLPWLMLRGNGKTLLKMAVCAAVCIFLPWLWRYGMGWQDIHNYYTSFLEPFKDGRVEPEFHNQSLSAAIFKICLPTTLDAGYNYRLFNLNVAQAQFIYKCSFLLMGVLLMGFLLWERFVNKQNTLRGIALIIICMHLLSGITWEYHLVSLLFVYAVFALYYKRQMGWWSKFFFYVLGFFIVLFSIVGKDTVGTFMYHYLEGYSVVTWTMVGLFFYMFFNRLETTNEQL